MDVSSAGAVNTTLSIGDIADIGLWCLFGLAVVVRLTWILFQRKQWLAKRKEVKDKIAAPILRSGAVQSNLYGWPPVHFDGSEIHLVHRQPLVDDAVNQPKSSHD